MPSSDHCGWGDFPHTVLHFADASSDSIDLRKEVSAEAIRVLTRIGLEWSFGVITAHNPMGITQSTQWNDAIAAELLREVAAMGVPFALLDACSPDRSHCERSIAVSAPCSGLIQLARSYDQLAIFWFDGSSFWIVPARSTMDQVRLPIANCPGSPDE